MDISLEGSKLLVDFDDTDSREQRESVARALINVYAREGVRLKRLGDGGISVDVGLPFCMVSAAHCLEQIRANTKPATTGIMLQ